MTRVLGAVLTAATMACAAAAVEPATLRLNEDACGHCRMTIVSMKTAAQVVVPGQEPVFFDDIACLQKYLDARPLPDGGIAFVAEHQAGEWMDLRLAEIVTTPESTPMGSGLIAREKGGPR
jgi:hypothetical protein